MLISRTALWVVVAAAFVGALYSATGRELNAQSPPPNIVLIFPDNLGWGEVGA